MSNENQTIKVIIDGAHGIYVPQIFVESFNAAEWGIEEEDIKVLKEGPSHEYYWDTWETVLNNAEFKDEDGKVWTLHQDSDLFAVREDHEWDEE